MKNKWIKHLMKWEGNMNKKLIDRYITLPMAIKIFRDDREKFKKSSVADVYLSKIDSVLEHMQSDFYALKSDLVSKHHIEIRRIGKGKYSVNGKEVIEYTPDQLKAITGDIMRDYLYKDKATEFERRYY